MALNPVFSFDPSGHLPEKLITRIVQEPIYVSGPLNSELLLAPSLSASRQFTGNESEKRTELRQTTEASTVKDPFHELRLLSQRSMSGQLECHGR